MKEIVEKKEVEELLGCEITDEQFEEDNMLFIVDEASGVADPIMEAILGTLSGANNKLLMCGNPTRTSGTFYDAFNVDRSIYRCHTVSSADSKRTNKQNIESLIRKYGPVNAAGKVPEETIGDGKQKACDIYDNMTTYLWGTVKDALMMEEVSLENDNELVAQFTCRKYRLTSRGKMLLESKEEMKKRGIDSPDRADAVALSCYQKKTFNIGSLVD